MPIGGDQEVITESYLQETVGAEVLFWWMKEQLEGVGLETANVDYSLQTFGWEREEEG